MSLRGLSDCRQSANYLTSEEAAEELRLSNKTVRRMLLAGRLPGTRVAGRWRISAQVVSEILDGKANRDEIQRYCDENRAIVAEMGWRVASQPENPFPAGHKQATNGVKSTTR